MQTGSREVQESEVILCCSVQQSTPIPNFLSKKTKQNTTLQTYLHSRQNKIRITKVFSFFCKKTLFLLGELEYAMSPDKRQITCPFLAEGIILRQD